MRLDQGHLEGAQLHWRSRGDHQDAVLGKPLPPSDVGRRIATDNHGAGALGDGRAVQGVVVVGVNGKHRGQLPDPGPMQRGLDPRRRRRQLARSHLDQSGAGEKAVGQNCRGAVVDQ
jgi:hypothetical protein